MANHTASATYYMSPSSRGGSIVLVVLAAFFIILLLVAIGIYILTETVVSLEDERMVNVRLMLSGNYVVVSIYPEYDVFPLTSVTLHIGGVEISAGQDTCQVSVGDRSASLIYAGLAKGVTGQRFITIAVTFRTGPRR